MGPNGSTTNWGIGRAPAKEGMNRFTAYGRHLRAGNGVSIGQSIGRLSSRDWLQSYPDLMIVNGGKDGHYIKLESAMCRSGAISLTQWASPDSHGGWSRFPQMLQLAKHLPAK